MTKKVLLLAANTRDRQYLSLRAEIEKIKFIAGSKNVEVCLDATTEDLYNYLDKDKLPHIIHFCGHGMPDGLILVDNYGKAHKVPAEALSNLFKHVRKKGVQCVFLNTCYSELIADAISQYVDFVIGMDSEVTDSIAIHFSTAFYKAIIKGKFYPQSYRAGCDRIALESIASSTIPKIKQGSGRHVAEEITAIEQLWFKAKDVMELKPLIHRLAALRQQYPTYRKAKQLEHKIRRTARITRTPKGVLSFLQTVDIFSVAVIAVWIGLATFFEHVQTKFLSLSGEPYILIWCFCIVGGYTSQVLACLSWYSFRPIGMWQQVLARSLLPEARGTAMRVLISGVIWAVLERNLPKELMNSYNISSTLLYGLVVGLSIGMVMVVLTLWEISLAPTRQKT